MEFLHNDLKNSEKRQQLEYSTQFFGFTPDAFVDTLMADATEIVKDNLKEAKKHCLKSFDGKVTEEEAGKCFNSIEDSCIESTENIFYKFGLHLKENVLKIPAHVLLPEDSMNSNHEQQTTFSLKVAKDNFENVILKARNLKYKKAALEYKLDNMKACLQNQSSIIKQQKELAILSNELTEYKKELEKLSDKKQKVNELMRIYKVGTPSKLSSEKRKQTEVNDQIISKKLKKSDDV